MIIDGGRHSRTHAFTMIEMMVAVAIIALLVGLLIPALALARKTAWQMTNGTQLHGQHQAMIIYAQSNLAQLPGTVLQQAFAQPLVGLDTNNVPVRAGLATTGSLTDDGSVVAPATGILLNGGFIEPKIIISPGEPTPLTPWSTNSVTTANHSYAMLTITTNMTYHSVTPVDQGRIVEWVSHTNGAAAMISDRNACTTANPTYDINVQSIWTLGKLGISGTPAWKGNIVWGDSHTTFGGSIVNTVYNGKTNTQDNLFAKAASGAGATKVTDTSAGGSSANAFMTVTN